MALLGARPWQSIAKAKTRSKVKVRPTTRRVAALGEQMEKAVSIDLLRGIRTFRRRVKPEQMLNAFATGSYSGVMGTIPWEELPGDLAPAMGKVRRTAFEAGEQGIVAAAIPKDKRLRWDVKNPRLREHIDNRTASLVTMVNEEQRDLIREAVTRQFQRGLTPRDVADRIVNRIGLNKPQAAAAERYRQGLEDKEVHPDRIESMVESYQAQLLDQRALTIARTEVHEAANAGQQLVWNESVKQGLLPARTQKQWIINPGACPICLPMDGVSVPILGQWTLRDGRKVDRPTQSHPNCRCLQTVLYDDDDRITLEDDA